MCVFVRAGGSGFYKSPPIYIHLTHAFFALHQWSPTHIISGSSCTHVASDRCTNQQPSTSINYHQVSGSHAQIVHIQSWLEQNHLNPPFRLRKAETSFCYWTHAKMQGSSLMMLITLQYPWPSLWICWSLMRPSCNLCRHPFPRSGFRQSGWAIFQWVTYFRLLWMKQLLSPKLRATRRGAQLRAIARCWNVNTLPALVANSFPTIQQNQSLGDCKFTASQHRNMPLDHLWESGCLLTQAKWLKTMLDS